MMTEAFAIEVAYAASVDEQVIVSVEVEPGATVRDALAAVAEHAAFAALDLASMPVGVFGEPCARDRVLEHEDRVELYRPLLIDPKEARRQRATRS